MIGVLLTLVVVGVVLYLINTYIPMDPPVRTVITVVVVIFLCIWLLSVFGVVDMPIPRLNR